MLSDLFGLQSSKEGKQSKIDKKKKRKLLIKQKNDERKEKNLHCCHFQYKFFSPSPMNLFSNLSYKENEKLHKKKKKTRLKIDVNHICLL